MLTSQVKHAPKRKSRALQVVRMQLPMVNWTPAFVVRVKRCGVSPTWENVSPIVKVCATPTTQPVRDSVRGICTSFLHSFETCNIAIIKLELKIKIGKELASVVRAQD